jgi:hypothetical protein
MCLKISQNVCVAIILTVARNRTSDQKGGLNNTNNRRFWYENSLRLWNQDHTIRDHITVVENSLESESGSHSQLEVINFPHSSTYELKHCGRLTRAMGEHELISLHEGISRSTRTVNATHIIKITGRYYIPGFANTIRNIKDTDRIIHMHGYAGGVR